MCIYMYTYVYTCIWVYHIRVEDITMLTILREKNDTGNYILYTFIYIKICIYICIYIHTYV
jgi:hypothetical protein